MSFCAPEPPEIPTGFQLAANSTMTPVRIQVRWTCRRSNAPSQTFYTQLTDVVRNSVIASQNQTVDDSFYDKILVAVYDELVGPDTDYKITLWTVNSKGQSDIKTLTVRSPPRPNLVKTIVMTDSQATVTYQIDNWDALTYNLSSMIIRCCETIKQKCTETQLSIAAMKGRVTMTVPRGTTYSFDFYIYDAEYNDLVFLKNDVRVPPAPGTIVIVITVITLCKNSLAV